MRWFKKRKLFFLPLPIWIMIVVLLLIVGGIATARIIEEVTSTTEVVEPLSVTDKVDFSTPIWPCTSAFLTFNVVNDAPVTYGLRLTPEDVTFPEGVHFGEVTVSGEPYTWGEAAEIPPYETVTISIEVIADCDSELGTVEVTIAVERVAPGEPALPLIGYSPSSFSFEAEEDGANPSDQTLSIWNAGGGTLNWSVSDDADGVKDWLSLSPTGGTDSGTVTLSVDISGMGVGEYDADITITAPGATNTPQTVPVHLSITAPGPVTYDLTVTSDGCCPIDVGDPINQTVAAGASQTFYNIDSGITVALTADDSEPDCDFVEWTGDVDLAGATNPNEVTMDDDKSVTAVCEGVGFDLTVTSDGCCPIDVGSPINQTVAAGASQTFYDIAGGTTVTLTADDSDPDCDFDEWTGNVDLSAATNPNQVTMDDDKSVTAVCTEAVAEPPVPEVCCWCIYYVEWWALPNAPPAAPTSTEYFALHTEEWLEAGHYENPPDVTIPDPSWQQETSFYDMSWNPMAGAARTNDPLGAVTATSVGYWNSSLTMLNWKARFNVVTVLGALTLFAWTLDITETSGNAGWPFAVGNEWLSTSQSSITAPATSVNRVVGMEVITTPLFTGGIECYKVETSTWEDDGDGIVEEFELTLSGIRWYHNSYGCPIKSDAYPGALYDGFETQDMVWYCSDPPYPVVP